MIYIHIIPWDFQVNHGGTEVFTMNLARKQTCEGHSCFILSPGNSNFVLDDIRIIQSKALSNEGNFLQRNGVEKPVDFSLFEELIIGIKPDVVFFHCYWISQNWYLKYLISIGVQIKIIPHLVNFLCMQGDLRFKNSTPCDGSVSFDKCFDCNFHQKVNNGNVIKILKKILPSKYVIFFKSDFLLNNINRKWVVKNYIEKLSDIDNANIEILVLSPWYKEVINRNLNKVKIIDFWENRLKLNTVNKRTNNITLELLFVGRLLYDKGIVYLIETMRKFEVGCIHLTVVGKDPDGFMNSKDLPKNISYIGPLNNKSVIEEMCKADFLLIPSLVNEMRPLVVIEAKSVGLPVIGSDFGGIKDLLIDAEDILFDIKNKNALFDILTQLIYDSPNN